MSKPVIDCAFGARATSEVRSSHARMHELFGNLCVYHLNELEVAAACHMHGSLSSAVLDGAQRKMERDGQREE